MTLPTPPSREAADSAGSADNPRRGAKQQFFPVTNWAVVLQAARSDFSVSGPPQDDLLRLYLPPLRNFLLRARRLPADHVEDIVQGFVADKVLKGELFRKADKSRGRFRNLVLKSLCNYVATWYAKDARNPLRAAEVDAIPDVAVAASQTEQFDHEWASQTVTAALEAMKAECLENGRNDVWEVFYCRVVRPAYEDAPEVPYEELIAQFGLSAPREAINLLVTAKRTFVRCLRTAIERYAVDAKDVDGELADIRGILLRSRNMGGVAR